MNLYELSKEVQESIDLYLSSFDPDTGEQIVTDGVVTERMQVMKELQNKGDDMASWALKTRTNAIARGTMLDLESKRIANLAQREGKTAERMEKIVELFFPDTGKAVPFEQWEIKYSHSKVVNILDVTKIPKEFMRTYKPVTKESEPDKKKIKEEIERQMKEAIEEGKAMPEFIVPGTELKQNSNLKIS